MMARLVFLIALEAEGHRAEAEVGYRHPGGAELYVLHRFTLS